MALALWHTGTKAQTLKALKDSDRLHPDLASEMTEVEQEDKINDWCLCVLQCRICSHKQIAITPSEAIKLGLDFDCANCGNMSCDIIEEDELD